ncbi:MAG: PAS domain S-box protein [Phycisphaerales bacterium]|nr:PAS domain S-box protein [Phycisphaerales bacterium]
MDDSLLRQTRLAALSIHTDHLLRVSVGAYQQDYPAARSIQQQLRDIRAANPLIHKVSLLRQDTDGRWFTLMSDSISDGITSLSEYPDTGTLQSSGESTLANPDREWVGSRSEVDGRWISGRVPIRDGGTQADGLYNRNDAQSMAQQAVAFYREHGRSRFLEECNRFEGMFHQRSLYALAYDHDMTIRGHPVKPGLLGKNLLDEKDWSGGSYFRREIQKIAMTQGSGWVDYLYEEPVSKQLRSKSTYLEKVDDLIICAGVYQASDRVLGMLQVDVEAGVWRQHLINQAALPVGLIVLLLLVLIVLMLGITFGALSRTDVVLSAQYKSLEEGEKQLRQLTEHSRTIIWEIDVNGRFTDISHAVEMILGYQPAQLIGHKSYLDLHPPEGRDEFGDSMQALWNRGVPYANLEHRFHAADGRIVWVNTYGIALFQADGTLRGFRGSATDISTRVTAQQQIQVEQTNLRAIFTSAPVGMLLLDQNGCVELANQVVGTILDKTPEQIVGQRPGNIIGCSSAQETPWVVVLAVVAVSVGYARGWCRFWKAGRLSLDWKSKSN